MAGRIAYYGNIVRDGLVLDLDAAKKDSYPGSGATWRDISGNGLNGTLIASGPNAVSASYSFANGGNIIFSGNSSSVILTRPVQDDFALCCWFRTNQIASASGFPQWYGGMGLVDCEVANVVDDFGTSIGAGKVLFGTGRNTPSTDLTITSSLTYNDNAWHHMIATRIRSTGNITLYIDAQQVATGTGGVQSLTSPTNMRIGAIQVNNNFFSGSIANVQVYNRALSAAEVLQNYNAQKSRYGL
jgi:hypothetical protein